MCLYTLISSHWAFSSLGKMTSDVYLCMSHVPVLSSSSYPFTWLTPTCLHFFCWGAQNINQHSTWVSPGWEEGKDCLPCLLSTWCPPGAIGLLGLQRHNTGSPLVCSQGSLGPFLKNCFSASAECRPACTCPGSSFSLGVGLGIYLCWIT